MNSAADRPAREPFIVMRLWPDHHNSRRTLDELIRLLKRHPPGCDEVWFCTEAGFPPLAVHRRSAERMARAAATMRAAGFLPGVQIANTLGHADGCLRADGIRWQRIVGHDGRTARMSHCPRAPGLHAYLRAMVRAYAAWQPSSVWIDDDLRMQYHMPVAHGCFCEACVAAFAQAGAAAGERRPGERESLVKALLAPGGGALRLAWTQFNQASLASVARTVAMAVHDVAPACRLGLQHAGPEWGLYNGPDLREVFATLAEVSGRPVGSRPGGGFYTDHRPREMLNKGYTVARQAARVPACVSTVCPEIENFTHTAMGKTPHGTVVESTLDLALGCNALSYAILCSGHERMAWYEALLARIAQWRPFWERFVAHNAGTVPGGLEVKYGERHAARPLRAGEGFAAWTEVNLDRLYQWSTFGLPLCAGRQGACGVLLCAKVVDGLNDAELREILAGGVLADGEALTRLQERRVGRLLGVRARPALPSDAFERFTADPLNGPHGGHLWKQYPFGASSPYFRLEPTSARARILGTYLSPGGEPTAPATVAVETGLGGRLVVLGANGWEHVVSSARRAQILAAADWISRGRLPVLVETSAQVAVVPRVDEQGGLRSVTFLNVGLDSAPPLSVRLRGVAGPTARWMEPGRRARTLALRGGTRERRLLVPSLPAWSIGYARFAPD
jgi:hypothetical protein